MARKPRGRSRSSKKAPKKPGRSKARTVKRASYQTDGEGHKVKHGLHGSVKDKHRKAKAPGTRISKTGRKYSETRVNRSDKNRSRGL